MMVIFRLGNESGSHVAILADGASLGQAWLHGEVKLSVDGFAGSYWAYFDRDDLVRFERELAQLDSALAGEASLAPPERQLLLAVKVTTPGQLVVNGRAVFGATFQNKFDFQFELDQTFLPPPVKQLRTFLQDSSEPGKSER